MIEIELGKHYMAGDFGAEWIYPLLDVNDPAESKGYWFMMCLSTGNAVGKVDSVEELLRYFPEFEHSEEVFDNE